MATFTQASRPLTIESVLGADTLLLLGFYGEESVSALPRFSLELMSADAQIPAERMLGSAVSIAVETSAGSPRHFHGIVSRFTQGDRDDGQTAYSAEVVAWPSLLAYFSDCRVFQNLSVPDIVEKVFSDRGFSDYDFRLRGTYEPHEYCVQYNESDLAFVLRLMEEEGIYYFVEHEKNRHVLVLSDHPTRLSPAPGAETVHMASAGASWDSQNVVLTLRSDHRLRPGKFTLTDYNPLKPSAQLLRSAGDEKYEIYEYPGSYQDHDEGERRALIRLEEQELSRHVVEGESTCRALRPGALTEITDHYRRSLNAKYHITSVRHSIRQPIAAGDDGAFEYRNTFFAIPHDVQFRPPRQTPRPRVQGVQTATVVGPSGEEIFTDKHGRVKVQFHWDRVGKKDEKSSCWVRVATPWAGKQWGAIHIPRVGQEVVVEFLDGDPDQPIIIGSVYNGEQMPPFTLPADQTKSGVRSRSSKDGSTDTVNELHFEDKKGSELILLHAEKDMTIEVENDEKRDVLHDRTTTIKNNDTRTVQEGNDAATIEKGDQTLEISTGKQTVTIKGNQAVTLKQGNQVITLDQGNQELLVKMGNQTTKVNLGKSATQAMQEIELKVGQSSIKIDQKGVTIKGMMVKIEGQVQTEVKGLMTTVKGTAMLTAKGGITMIN